MQEFPVWTLQEANEALPEVIEITQTAAARLEALQHPWGATPFQAFDALRGVPVEDAVRAEWARQVASLGVQPKGFFVADFQSPDPDTVWCWGFGEERIEHEHKVWETFVDRRRIRRQSRRDEVGE